MKKKVFIAGVSLFVFFFVFASASQAAWYTCNVQRVAPKANGEVTVFVTPGTGETGFTGTARVYLDRSDSGKNQMLATILTAVSLGQEIQVDTAAPPAWGTPFERVSGVQLIMF